MANQKTLILGTRGSNMAVKQSTLVKDMIEAKHPHIKVELKIILTKGDEGQKTAASTQPLWKVEGKNFFSSDIDQALQQREIDLAVHSHKDLSSERPEGLYLAAIPHRGAPHDIAIFNRRVLDLLRTGQPIRVGTSALRRIENAGTFLPTVLPQLGQPPKLDMVPIRGNVPSRLKRLELPADDEKYVDAVVLGAAGIQLLFEEAEVGPWLKEFLAARKLMILPLSLCPASPAQGALAVECHEDDQDTRQLLATIHNPAVALHVNRERTVMKRLGGGCHQKFGATSVDLPHIAAPIMLVHGRDGSDQHIHWLEWDGPTAPASPVKAWDGSQWRGQENGAPQAAALPKAESLFIAHHRAVRPEHVADLQSRRLWTSGITSWQALAAQGLWVEGCADGFGIDSLTPLLELPALQLPPLSQWGVLTHHAALSHWPKGQAVATYTVPQTADGAAAAALKTATHIFWASGSQFDLYKQHVPAGAHHACRCGHTAQHVQVAGAAPLTVFPTRESWQEWIGNV